MVEVPPRLSCSLMLEQFISSIVKEKRGKGSKNKGRKKNERKKTEKCWKIGINKKLKENRFF